jgi:AcrR family transcriptional regulator
MSTKGKKAEHSRSRLLDAAARIFRERGYVGTTMRAIASQARVEAGSIYYHYRSKEELIGAVLDYGMTALSRAVREAIGALPPGTSARQRIETAVAAHLAAILQIGDYTLAMRRVQGQVPSTTRRRHLRMRDEYAEVWHGLLAAAQREGALRAGADLNLARLFLLGALNGTVEWYRPNGKPVETLANDFATMVLDGLFEPELAAAARRPDGRMRRIVRNNTSRSRQAA